MSEEAAVEDRAVSDATQQGTAHCGIIEESLLRLYLSLRLEKSKLPLILNFGCSFLVNCKPQQKTSEVFILYLLWEGLGDITTVGHHNLA